MSKNVTISNEVNDNKENHNMTKAELIDKVSVYAKDEFGLTKRATTEVVNRFVGEVAEAIGRGEEVSIHGLGKFETREREHLIYPGVRPGDKRDGVTAVKEVRKHVNFRSARSLKDSVNPE